MRKISIELARSINQARQEIESAKQELDWAQNDRAGCSYLEFLNAAKTHIEKAIELASTLEQRQQL